MIGQPLRRGQNFRDPRNVASVVSCPVKQILAAKSEVKFAWAYMGPFLNLFGPVPLYFDYKVTLTHLFLTAEVIEALKRLHVIIHYLQYPDLHTSVFELAAKQGLPTPSFIYEKGNDPTVKIQSPKLRSSERLFIMGISVSWFFFFRKSPSNSLVAKKVAPRSFLP